MLGPLMAQWKDPIPSPKRTDRAVGLAGCHMTHRLKQNKRAHTGPETGKNAPTPGAELGKAVWARCLLVRKCPRPSRVERPCDGDDLSQRGSSRICFEGRAAGFTHGPDVGEKEEIKIARFGAQATGGWSCHSPRGDREVRCGAVMRVAPFAWQSNKAILFYFAQNCLRDVTWPRCTEAEFSAWARPGTQVSSGPHLR